ncbi:MAG: hypothetical protein JOY90_00360 [Bradyrhizobium sp.]|nr:hypothetical protein [Bradyrhizobium sp.]
MDGAAVVAQSLKPIGRQQQRAAEIDNLGLLRDEQRRRDRPAKGADKLRDQASGENTYRSV